NIDVRLVVRNSKSSGPAPRDPNGSATGDSSGIGTPTAARLGNPGDLGPGETAVKSTKTDSQGNFTMTDVASGTYMLVAGTGKAAVRNVLTVTDADPKPQMMKLPKV